MLDAIALPRERRPVRSYAKPAADPSLAAIRQLEAGGLDPRDVRHIVQTHLDLDYVGGLADYPWATVHVHESELDAALARRDVKGRGRYRPAMWAHGPRWEVYSEEGEAWRGFVAVRELKGLPSEILPVPLFGHTRGHCGVAIQSSEGWVFDAGDAFFDPREVHGPRRVCAPRVRLFEDVVTTDRSQRVANQQCLRAFISENPEIDVFAAHNPTHPSLAPRQSADSASPSSAREGSAHAGLNRVLGLARRRGP
ncbi:MAG: MBL fold metallo-hydrolase [Acidimicrobiales bacterium]|jgi:glyoxylase-like metal-dependent hydrolase (beta-lactamase superfamily II)